MRCHLFWTPHFYLYASKKCGQSVYIGKFGLPLPQVPIYAECPHRRVNIRYIEETYFNLWKIEFILNKANAYIYVCCLSVVLCHRQIFVFVLFIFLVTEFYQKLIGEVFIAETMHVCYSVTDQGEDGSVANPDEVSRYMRCDKESQLNSFLPHKRY